MAVEVLEADVTDVLCGAYLSKKRSSSSGDLCSVVKGLPHARHSCPAPAWPGICPKCGMGASSVHDNRPGGSGQTEWWCECPEWAWPSLRATPPLLRRSDDGRLTLYYPGGPKRAAWERWLEAKRRQKALFDRGQASRAAAGATP